MPSHSAKLEAFCGLALAQCKDALTSMRLAYIEGIGEAEPYYTTVTQPAPDHLFIVLENSPPTERFEFHIQVSPQVDEEEEG